MRASVFVISRSTRRACFSLSEVRCRAGFFSALGAADFAAWAMASCRARYSRNSAKPPRKSVTLPSSKHQMRVANFSMK